MKLVTLAITSLAAVAFSAGLATAQMQPIPNPPDHPHPMMGHHGHHGHWRAHRVWRHRHHH
jgi:Spy/CpxP family protein refolding chaperone